MQLIRQLETYHADAPLALAIGNFDGLHRGHRAVIDQMLALAAEKNLVPAILTFEPHPRRFFAPSAPVFRLQTLHDKLAQLQSLGVQRLFALRFNAAMASVSAEAFLQDILYRQMGARAVVTGEDFAFGRGRAGTSAMLQAWGATQGVATVQVPPVMAGGMVCSSSAVRAALAAGDMQQAQALLGRAYALGGRVGHGHKRGRELGFPTANIVPHALMKLPRYGVYAVRVARGGKNCDGVANIGLRPTVQGTRPQLEVHLFDYAGDLYGQRLAVSFIAHLRDEKRFDSLPTLAHQIALDAAQARQVLKAGGG